MAGDLCPYCGTLLTTSLKFCVNCRRSVTEDKIKQLGAGREEASEDEGGQGKFKLARRGSHDTVRQFRSFFLTASALLAVVFIYYCSMKFVAKQPIPFEDELTKLFLDLQKQQQ